MNPENLIPNSERSPEELREMGRKGGIKSGETRRRQRDAKKLMSMFTREFIIPDLEKVFSEMWKL